MERLGIFETQRRHPAIQRMLALSGSTFGYKDVTWKKRALLAIPEAGIEGQELTSTQMEAAFAPLIGFANNKEARALMVILGREYGIMHGTGEKVRAEGSRCAMPTYKITGHLEMRDDEFVAVPMGDVCD